MALKAYSVAHMRTIFEEGGIEGNAVGKNGREVVEPVTSQKTGTFRLPII